MSNRNKKGEIMDVRQLVQIRPHERQIAWQELGFTAFLHFGMNTFTNREWGTGKESPARYNPARLDTDQWCAALASAGIRACVLTAKHHDGFCLWDTAYTKHSVMSSPCPRDVAALLAASCEQYGLKLGFYLSPWDMHEPCYGTGGAYNDFFCGQLAELLTRYGPLYSLWFDGANGEGPGGKRQDYDWDRYYSLIRRHQSGAVIASVGPDVRWIGNEAGAARPSEWSVVPARLRDAHLIAGKSQKAGGTAFRERGISHQDEDLGSRAAVRDEQDMVWYPAEVDVSIRPGWFYHPEEDSRVKPLETLLGFYESSVGGNAALLLNIPPDTDGRIHAEDSRRLAELGEALQTAFSRNLLAEAGVQVRAGSEDPSHPARGILRDDEDYWRPNGETESAGLDITLPRPETVSRLVLAEQIRESQRIERFQVFAQTEKGWEPLFRGSTVGYKKICAFPPVKTPALRIAIEQSRLYPTLRFAGVYEAGNR
jgi:alpha-L-fucosidase